MEISRIKIGFIKRSGRISTANPHPEYVPSASEVIIKEQEQKIKDLEGAIERLACGKFERLSVKKNGLSLDVLPPHMISKILVSSFKECLGEAENFVEMTLDNQEDGEQYAVLIQKVGMKTPAQVKGEVEKELNKAREVINELLKIIKAHEQHLPVANSQVSSADYCQHEWERLGKLERVPGWPRIKLYRCKECGVEKRM